MKHTLKSDQLTIDIESLGGELMSIRSQSGHEYLWQGDAMFWKGRATNLFPFVGRLIEERYLYKGQSYNLKIHGFVKEYDLKVEESTDSTLAFLLKSDEDTLSKYPFSFEYRIRYTLKGSKLEMEYQVINKDDKAMYFGIGGHPGFFVPIKQGLTFEDYYLEFDEVHTPNLQLLTDTCFITGKKEPYPLKDGKILPLEHSLFDRDALVFSEINTGVTLKSDKDNGYVRVEYPDMPYLGLWHKPKTEAPYVCIEPWASMPGSDGEITDLERKADLVKLEAGKTYSNLWSITIGL